ncbi:MAG TPA: EF-hand domain-containing protein [Planctomycetaceae bacterium]|nr:EF-hand domain-containing protein [Planctomycetaceae bacterium]
MPKSPVNEAAEPEATPPGGSKLERIRHQPPPTALPPRQRVKSKKQGWKSPLPVGYGVVGATLLVVGAVLVCLWSMGSRSATKVVAVDQRSVNDGFSSLSKKQSPVEVTPPVETATPTPVAPEKVEASSSQGRASMARKPKEDASDGSVPPGQTAAANVGDSASSTVQADKGNKPQVPQGGPLPEKASRHVRSDGGPKRGTSIEQYFRKLDANGDNRLDSTELPLFIIGRADTDKDGELTLSELKRAFKRLGQKLFDSPTRSESGLPGLMIDRASCPMRH